MWKVGKRLAESRSRKTPALRKDTRFLSGRKLLETVGRAAITTANIPTSWVMQCIDYGFPLTYLNITAAGSRNATVTRLRKRMAGQLSAPYCGKTAGKGKAYTGTHHCVVREQVMRPMVRHRCAKTNSGAPWLRSLYHTTPTTRKDFKNNQSEAMPANE